jgi:hypothetical protein
MPEEPPDWVKATTPTPEEQAEIKAGIARVVAQRVICATCGEGWVPQPGETGCPWCAAAADAEEMKKVNGYTPPDTGRRLHLTPASQVKMRPVHWLWEGRVPLGCLTLLGGREGLGKSTLAYQLTADITKGTLVGTYFGKPKAVIVAATEDSWEHTIAPRLTAAGADMDKVFRVDVVTDEGLATSLTLPVDLLALEQAVKEVDAALILLDPLISRLAAKLDTHKDAEVRIGLEPVTSLADRCRAAVIGLIHVNKGASTDPLTLLMGSRAFAAVARAVLFVMTDPDDETGNTRLMGVPKNNLGRTDLPTLAFMIESVHVATTEEGEVWTSRIDWKGESSRTIHDAMEASGEGSETRTATAEAVGWLEDYLMSVGGSDASAEVKKHGAKVGHAHRTLERAAGRLKVDITTSGYPRRSYWTLPIAVIPPPEFNGASHAKLGATGVTETPSPVTPGSLGDGFTGVTGVTVESGETTTLHSGASGAYHVSPPARGATDDFPPSPEIKSPF